jgi:phosphopantothenoylcysteine decarboxylase/phosphopantothenate--cysteine ligase
MTRDSDKTPTVLIGVTGSIAAYKACELVRALQKRGAKVKVVMTAHATEFVSAATFRALTNEPVAVELFDEPGAPIHHISLAQEADVFVIAPATANVINKIANGVADDLLTTTALATESPLLVAPAMNVHMWRDETTQRSIELLRALGVQIVEPESGYLACGDAGEGRLAEVDVIANAVMRELASVGSLAGKKVLITAGSTREHLDPVRFISSPASGRTGYELAREAARRGADVVLVSGPTSLPDPFGCKVIRVTSALEMLDASRPEFQDADYAIFTAAVSDFRPAHRHNQKVKKDATGDPSLTTLDLVENPDIIATLATPKNKGNTYVIGFAAETNDVISNAQAKLVHKNADLIIANDVSDPSLGFASIQNRVWFVSKDAVWDSGVIPKTQLAALICEHLAKAGCKDAN